MLLVVNALLSLLMVLVVFTLSCCATCPFLPWIHLNDYLAIALSILRGGWSEVDYYSGSHSITQLNEFPQTQFDCSACWDLVGKQHTMEMVLS
jgi:hypothetical protein